MFNTIATTPLIMNTIVFCLGIVIAIAIVACAELWAYKKISKISLYMVSVFSFIMIAVGAIGVHTESYNNPTYAYSDEESHGDEYISVRINHRDLQQDIQMISNIEDVNIKDFANDDEFLIKLKKREHINFTGVSMGEQISGEFYYTDRFLIVKATIPGDNEESIFRTVVS